MIYSSIIVKTINCTNRFRCNLRVQNKEGYIDVIFGNAFDVGKKNYRVSFLLLTYRLFFLLNLKPHITNENMIAAHTLKNAKFRTKYKQVPTILNHQKNAIKITVSNNIQSRQKNYLPTEFLMRVPMGNFYESSYWNRLPIVTLIK